MDNYVKLDSGKSLKLISLSSREVRLQYHPLSTIKERVDNNGNITGLSIDGYEILAEDAIIINIFDKQKRPFKIKDIKVSRREYSYSLFSTRLTKASKYIMPMIRTSNQTRTSMKYTSHFINCYVGTEDEGYMDEFHLVYRYSADLTFKAFEESMVNHELFDRRVDIDYQHVMYTFIMTDENKEIFKLFKEGKYSEFSDEYKNKIISFNINPALVNASDIKNTIDYGVLYKTDKQRESIENLVGEKIGKDLELLSIPYESEEVYTGDIEIKKASMLN